jgi:LPXTG-motif cell wall-anchored protein
MKNLGIVAIVVGVVLIIVGLVSASSNPTGLRSLTAVGVILVAGGLILYRRGRRNSAR